MNVIDLNTESFEETVTQEGIVLVDFWASWCGPCRAFEPIYERVAEKFPESTFGRLNTEQNGELSATLQIPSIPTLMVFRDGVLMLKQAGMFSEEALTQLIEKVAALDMNEVRAELEKNQAQAGSA